MVIHAQRTAFRSSAQFPDFAVTSPITAGQILHYDIALRAFINVDTSVLPGFGGSGIIDGAINLGSGSEIFKAVNVSEEIELRTLLGGQGISLVQGADEIEISNDIISNAAISVPDSFTIEIDNDNTTTDTAIFELLTNSNPASVVFTPITYTRTDLSVVTTNQFTTAAGDFVAAGFVVGMGIKVVGTTEQDGIWEIDTVTTDTITITIAFPDQTDAGLQPSTTIDGMFFEFTSTTTLVMFGRDLDVDGFVDGKSVVISGLDLFYGHCLAETKFYAVGSGDTLCERNAYRTGVCDHALSLTDESWR